jgi:hypothetical protein
MHAWSVAGQTDVHCTIARQLGLFEQVASSRQHVPLTQTVQAWFANTSVPHDEPPSAVLHSVAQPLFTQSMKFW